MGNRKRAFAFFAVNSLFNLASSFAHPVTPTVIQELALPDYMFGLALAVMMTTMFLFSPFWGKINAILSSRVCLLISCTGYAVGQLMFGLARGMAEILIARLLAGVFTGGVFVCSLAYVANTTPEEKRGQYLTIYATGQSVFNAFGYFVGGMLGEFGVWYAFLAQAICLLVSGVGFFVFCLPDADPAAGRPQLGTLVRECNPFAAFAAGKTFLNLTWVKLLGLCCFSYVGYNAFEQVFNYYIKDQFGLTSSYNGTIKFAVGAISLIANFTICIWMIRNTNIRRTILPVLVLSTLAILGVIVAPELLSFMGIAVVFYACYSISVPLTQNLVADYAGTGKNSSLIMGFYQAVRAIGGVIGALMAGVLYGLDPKVPFIFACAGFAISVVCGFLFYTATRKADAAR